MLPHTQQKPGLMDPAAKSGGFHTTTLPHVVPSGYSSTMSPGSHHQSMMMQQPRMHAYGYPPPQPPPQGIPSMNYRPYQQQPLYYQHQQQHQGYMPRMMMQQSPSMNGLDMMAMAATQQQTQQTAHSEYLKAGTNPASPPSVSDSASSLGEPAQMDVPTHEKKRKRPEQGSSTIQYKEFEDEEEEVITVHSRRSRQPIRTDRKAAVPSSIARSAPPPPFGSTPHSQPSSPKPESDSHDSKRPKKKVADMTPEERLEYSRMQSRDHSRKSRQRRKENEEKLKHDLQELAAFRTLVEDSSQFISIHSPDVDATFLYANPALSDLLELTDEDMKTLPLINLCHPDDQDKLTESIKIALMGGLKHKNSSIHWRIRVHEGDDVEPALGYPQTQNPKKRERKQPSEYLPLLSSLSMGKQGLLLFSHPTSNLA